MLTENYVTLSANRLAENKIQSTLRCDGNLSMNSSFSSGKSCLLDSIFSVSCTKSHTQLLPRKSGENFSFTTATQQHYLSFPRYSQRPIHVQQLLGQSFQTFSRSRVAAYSLVIAHWSRSNQVTLRWARLVLVIMATVCGRPRFVTSHSGQLSLLPSAGRKMSTGQSAVTLCGWG